VSDVSAILAAAAKGDPRAAADLLPLVYDELRKLAAARLAYEQPGHTLQATALVHEAYLRLVARPAGEKERRREGETEQQQDRSVPPSLHPSVGAFDSRGHFFAAAAESMRRILIDRAREKHRHKRGGGWQRVNLDSIEVALDTPAEDLLALNEALEQLAEHDKLAADLVKLRFFAGLSLGEAAEALAMPRRTADRQWAYARAWLFDRLSG